ncbi:hypothetical protein MINTMi27_15310 [Mycobacterium intracellulare]|nr:hypothetical protein MINTMi27_15310 [Mycobacterium intracellulare]
MKIYGKALATIQEGADDSEFGPHGGFRAVLSTPSEDRDYEQVKRSEWIEPLPMKCTLDSDHGMSVADTIGSFVPYFEDDVLMMKASFASTPKAQEVRALVNEGHVNTVSVAFMRHKDKKAANEPFRELLNAGVVAIPANRDAVILASKAASALKDAFSDNFEGEVPEEVKTAVLEALETKSPKPYGDVRYADPEQGKYPIDTVAHIRAALAYLGMERNRAALGDHLAHVEAAVHAAARAHGIDVHDPHKSVDDAETKAAVYVDVLPRIDLEAWQKSINETVAKAGATASGIGGDGALVQAIHDASSHLGAACPVIEVVDDHSGASDGANKSVKALDANSVLAGLDAIIDEAVGLSADINRQGLPEPVGQALDLLVGAKEAVGNLMKMLGVFDPDGDKSVTQEAFIKALNEVLTPDESPADEAAAASDEEPAPADEAADAKAKRMRSIELLAMGAQLNKSTGETT